MKKARLLILGLISFLLLIGLPYTSARADVIWTPSDGFFEKNYEKCVQVGRSYYVNGKEGYVQVLKSPSSSHKIGCIANGNSLYVSFSYRDKNGEDWGVVQYKIDEKGTTPPAWSDEGAATGWVKMDSLLVIYDNISFMEEHKKDLKEYKGDYDFNKCKEKLVFYSYPGSGVVCYTLSMKDYKDFPTPLDISSIYTDEQGKDWGYVVYYRNIRTAWICLSSPEDENLPKTMAEKADLVPPATAEQLKQAGENGGVWLVTALVLSVVLATAVLVRVFWKKK